MTEFSKRLLADLQDLAPTIAARAAEIEAGRRIPPDLVETLKSIGSFRMFVPRSHGGFQLDLSAGLAIITALARIEGSVGWAAMIGNGASLFPALYSQKVYDRIYKDGPNLIFAGSSTPCGSAEPAAGGWRVTGRWPFASGCQHADWLFGACVMKEKDAPRNGAVEGAPRIQIVMWPARHWRIEDTWHVAGLKGTGSHHVAIEDALIPEEYFLEFKAGFPCLPGPLYQSPRHFIPLFHNAVALGIADGALSDLVAMAMGGRQQFRATTTMRGSEIFQAALGRIEASLEAAQATHQVQTENLWRHALAGTLKGEALLTKSVQHSIWITATCVSIAHECFRLGGGGALYDSSPLQRRLRDIDAAAQHFAVQQRHYTNAGALLLGYPGDSPAGDGHQRSGASSA